MIKRVAITQPYVPGYRVPLWELTMGLLDDAGIEARVFFGGDPDDRAEIARRGDSASVAWAEEVPSRTIRVPFSGHKAIYRRLPVPWRDALLVTEMQATNGNAWIALTTRKPYITLGHGRAYTAGDNALGDGLESVLNRRSAHALTYTEDGRLTVIGRSRIRPERVTSFNNATDTRELRDALTSVTDADRAAFSKSHGIPEQARIALFVGALNDHKRIDLLVDAAKSVFEQDNRWWLVVAGEGPQAPLIDRLAAKTGRVVRLGQATPREYAPAARSAEVLLNPGRIGLVAVDALTMNLPVLTANAANHAPEAEYLAEGTNLFSSAPSPGAFAELWMSSPSIRATTSARPIPSIESAAAAIAAVIQRVSNESATRSTGVSGDLRNGPH